VVWVGADSPTPTKLLAGQSAVPIWAKLMREVRKERPPPLHVVPSSLRAVDVCDETGKLASGYCPHISRVLVRKSTQLARCDETRHLDSMTCIEEDGNEVCTLIEDGDGEENH
jgi:membrane carboxypeptidase/penicillin-binding protein